MLPITLVLILLMRMDSILMALNLQKQNAPTQQDNQNLLHESVTYNSDYNTSKSNLLNDLVNEQILVSIEQENLNKKDRLKRCLSFKFGLTETQDLEERDLMKDARTSFVPQDTTVIPKECFDKLIYGNSFSSGDSYEIGDDFFKKRLRRTSEKKNVVANNETSTPKYLPVTRLNCESYSEELNEAPDTQNIEKDISYLESALQSFWNEQGTKKSIRQAQANTMKKYMDLSVNPCTDFYRFACGNWEKMHPIPKDKAGFDTFEMLRENLDVVLKQLLESKDLDASKRYISAAQHNNYGEIKSVKSDNVKLGEKASISDNLFKEKIRLKRHIISQRHVLSRILKRYRRQTTNSKRKRLIPLFGASSNPFIRNTKPIEHSVSAQQKAKFLYQSCINTQLLQRRGIQPLLDLIENLGGWPVLNTHWNPSYFDWLNLTAQLRRYNNDILIVQWVGPDIKNSDENVIQFDQTSLGLPTREYFLQEMNTKYLLAYQRFMTEVMNKLGVSEEMALKTADELITFETHLAQITSPAELRLNVTKLYKRMTLRQLKNTVPEINWMRYLSILQHRPVRETEQVVIYAIDYMQDLVSLLAETESRIVANYLIWRFVRHRINNVDDRFEDTKQNFYHALFGREESPQRWKVCIAQVNTNMGMALGSMFVTKYFDENSKRDTLKMTHELQQAFRDILKTTDWLDGNTKHLAELKVNAMSLKIGYPDFILNSFELNDKYAGIDIDPDRYFENTLNVLLHTAKTEQNKLHEPVNKTAWQTAPAIVNAYYSRNKNQIMFPAGILQPPFYHRYFPRSLNFGGIGVVIGHELTHGFDDKGRLFDRNGSIHKWWTDSSIKGFDERARCIIAQYSNYTVGEVGISLNGESTQGENIADNGGIRQAFHAYKRWVNNNPEAARDERLPGINMTGEQLFFLNFGQVWCGAMRPEAVRNKLNTAIHSPGRFRVIGTLSNSRDFAREYHCPIGSLMNPIHKCSVW